MRGVPVNIRTIITTGICWLFVIGLLYRPVSTVFTKLCNGESNFVMVLDLEDDQDENSQKDHNKQYYSFTNTELGVLTQSCVWIVSSNISEKAAYFTTIVIDLYIPPPESSPRQNIT